MGRRQRMRARQFIEANPSVLVEEHDLDDQINIALMEDREALEGGVDAVNADTFGSGHLDEDYLGNVGRLGTQDGRARPNWKKGPSREFGDGRNPQAQATGSAVGKGGGKFTDGLNVWTGSAATSSTARHCWSHWRSRGRCLH